MPADSAPRFVLTAALAAGMIGLPASPAFAAPRSAPCYTGEVSSADRATAQQLKSRMTGKRLGAAVNGSHLSCARVIVDTVQARGLPQRAAVIAIATAIAESTLHNYTQAVDHDSLGLFQQRPSQGWGRPAQLTDPVFATNAFLNAMLRKYPGDRWMTGDIGAICQKVQVSAYPLAYTPEVDDAALIVNALWPQPAGTTTAPPPAAEEETPTGPYQKALHAGGAELGAMPGRHEVLTADWNGDGKTDLLAVKGTGTATGKTEVHIMDGASKFSRLSLSVATALGPTDETYEYAMGSHGDDKRPDLFVVRKSGTASGKTELRVLDGTSSFRQVAAETITGLPATDQRHRFAVIDGNLVVVQTEGTKSGKVELQIVDKASGYQKVSAVIVTKAPAGPDRDITVTDWNADGKPDLVLLHKSTTATGKTGVQVLDGASQFQKTLAEADTAPGVSTHLAVAVLDWNDDKRPDIMMLQTTGTASGRTELVILGG
ncbi:FG-GAP repeat domain-containing protein [Actinoplanes sp. G11-F43]|uniref:FG-GAP repeat domain-containing protein n=1 Tax=Actinoplanes sp. G11-F43 TaxID=3424130 RepID=UPI003D34D827